jgi:LacI family transcriptional regulator
MVRKLTIGDIAQLAGVSKATVSRVLNHKPDVDPATRERILRIMEEQRFVPNVTASRLAGGRSNLVGILVPSFTWPFISNILGGVAEATGKTPYELILYSISNQMHEDDSGDMIDHILATNLVAGLLAILPGQSAGYVARLYEQDFPVVMLDDQEMPLKVPWVGADNRGGALVATRHLIQLGHRRIAHVQGPMRYLCSSERYEGFCEGMQEAGLPVDPAWIIEGDFTEAGGRSAARSLFSLPKERRPSAIFAANDLTAYGMLKVASECDIHVPDDVALVGFDDLAPSAHTHPALTTVAQPFYEMGRRSAELLLSLIEKPAIMPHSSFYPPSLDQRDRTSGDDAPPVRIQLPTRLVIRESCGATLAGSTRS